MLRPKSNTIATLVLLGITATCIVAGTGYAEEPLLPTPHISLFPTDNQTLSITENILLTPNATTPAPLFIPAVVRNVRVPDISYAALSRPHKARDQKIEHIPLTVAVISAEEIHALRLHALKDVLVYFAGFSMLDTKGNGFDVSIGAETYSRGNAIALYIDGLLVNDGLMNIAPFLQYSAGDIERVEVFTPSAPYPMQYTKIIYVFTKHATAGPSFNVMVAGGNRGQGALGLSVTGLALSNAVQTSWHIDRALSDGIRRHDSLNQAARLTGRTTVDLSDTLSLDWVFRYGNVYQEYPGMLDEEQLQDDRAQSTTPHSGAENYLLSNALTWHYTPRTRTHMRGTIASARSIDDTTLTFREKAWSIEEWQKTEDRTQVNAEISEELSILPGTLTVGMDHINSATELSTYSIVDSVRIRKLSQLIFPRKDNALYGQIQLQWLEHGEFVYGLRSERTDIKAFTRTPAEKDDWDYTEQEAHSFAGLSYTVLDQWHLFMNTLSASVIDPYALYTDRSVRSGQKIRSEIGLNYHSFETLLSKKTSKISTPWRATIALYTIETRDDIFWFEGAPSNIDSLRSGIECSVRGQLLAQWTAFLTYTGQNASFASGEYSGKRIPMVPAMSYAAGLTYMPVPAWTITMIERYTAEQWAWNDVQNEQEHLKAYDLVDLRTDYQWEDVTFFLNVNNLFDKKYEVSETYLSFPSGTYYIPGARRMWEYGVQYAF